MRLCNFKPERTPTDVRWYLFLLKALFRPANEHITIHVMYIISKIMGNSGNILCVRPANERRCYIVTSSIAHNERRCYIVTSSFIDWTHAQGDPWYFSTHHNSRLNVLQRSSDIGNFSGMRWELLGCHVLSWTLIFLCLCKGIKSIGKVSHNDMEAYPMWGDSIT